MCNTHTYIYIHINIYTMCIHQARPPLSAPAGLCSAVPGGGGGDFGLGADLRMHHLGLRGGCHMAVGQNAVVGIPVQKMAVGQNIIWVGR